MTYKLVPLQAVSSWPRVTVLCFYGVRSVASRLEVTACRRAAVSLWCVSKAAAFRFLFLLYTQRFACAKPLFLIYLAACTYYSGHFRSDLCLVFCCSGGAR